ncbi:MAG TPA: hypothetical protein VE971_05320 [Candidatus Eisenbacteria bacterium]|nr:hypothetical protein [Candidatus Eisenbacteria bacterium]
MYLNNGHFERLLAENSSINSTIGKFETTTKPSPGLTSNPANILESFMSPKALLASTIDQIRNSTQRNDNSNNETSSRNQTIFVQNPGVLLLSHQIIPPKDFIPVYDAMPYEISNAQVSVKLPCDSNSKPSLQLLAGQFSELGPAKLRLIPTLSQPGYMCMYYANLGSMNNNTLVSTADNIHKVDGTRKSGVVTYIELFNPTEHRIILPSTASISVSVNQIKPLEKRNQNTGVTQTTPTLNQTTPTLNQTTPTLNQTTPTLNQTTPTLNQKILSLNQKILSLNQTTPILNQTTPTTSNQLSRLGISPTIAFVFNAWNPFLKQKTYLPIMPLVNETILSNSKCTLHAIWHSSKEEQSDLTELKEYSIINNKTNGNPPMFLHLCGGAPIP